jgi:XTP/dITP diphosphohydrolase
MITLYAATSNPGKLRDFAAAAENENISIKTLPELGELPSPAEDEASFEGNARLKAIYYSRFLPGEIVVADDSGVEVDALFGEPGVRSARFASDAGFATAVGTTVDERNNLYLLARLQGVPPEQRSARYRCVVVAARNGKSLFAADGVVEGEILTAPRGDGGFGYDPLFYMPELGRTMAEIDLATKHQISHRGKAIRALLLAMSSA